MSTAVTTETKPAPPAIEKIRVKVDGREIEVPRLMADWSGKLVPTTMIQACELAKTDVPHYCYHPKLPIAGNCRMCLVEFGTPALGPDRKPILNPDGTAKIVKSPRPAIACATPVSPGMEIYSNTPGVKQMREGVLEFLLINHPLDCPICDQAGECKLQEYSVDYGQSASRFVEPKVHKPKSVDLGPRIMLDDERCILCSRCIRFTRDIVGDDALGIVNRGSYNTLAAYPGKAFDNNYTLNTVDICPVGALTSKDFRFQMRVWFLKETKSICTSCTTGCNILIGSREEKIYRYTPRENDAVNGPWICDAGRLNYKWIGREDRLTKVQSPKSKAQRSTRLLVVGVDRNCRIVEEISGRFGGHRRVGPPDKRGTVVDFEIEVKAWRHQRFRSSHRRRRQIARQRGQKSEQQRRATDRPGRRSDGNKLAEDRRRHSKWQNQDVDCLWRRRDPTWHWRGFAGQAGNTRRERHFA